MYYLHFIDEEIEAQTRSWSKEIAESAIRDWSSVSKSTVIPLLKVPGCL